MGFVNFIENTAFTARVFEYLADDNELRRLQHFLIVNPEAGDLIQGTGGIRKLRWNDPSRGKGKRGGTRIIYFHFASDSTVYLITIYGKGEKVDLTAREKRILKNDLEAEKERRKAADGGKP